MAQIFNSLFGGGKAAEKPIGDADFADFGASTGAAAAAGAAGVAGAAGTAAASNVPAYTKWYNIHERYSLNDFKIEFIIFGLMAVVLVVHVIGTRRNRSKAHGWIKAHVDLLASEFAVVGFGRVPRRAEGSEASDAAVLESLANSVKSADPKSLLKENSLFEYASYATGRQNVAFIDIKLKLIKRFNPIVILAETILGFFVESLPGPSDTLEATLYPFDGKESLTVTGPPPIGAGKSTYDGFVWAIVNKDRMKTVRDDRFDVSITFTKDNAKLPPWLTVMSENAEITETLLTPELVAAAKAAGENLDYLIITDQPVDKPLTLDETAPRKRILLKYRLPSDNSAAAYESLLPIFSYFVRSADVLVQSAHLRPEVLRKVKATRDEIVKGIKKADEDSKAEERAIEREKQRKAKRDAELSALDSKGQKKYLDRERDKEMRRMSKKQTMRA